jgi:hypothetical protein
MGPALAGLGVSSRIILNALSQDGLTRDREGAKQAGAASFKEEAVRALLLQRFPWMDGRPNLS